MKFINITILLFLTVFLLISCYKSGKTPSASDMPITDNTQASTQDNKDTVIEEKPSEPEEQEEKLIIYVEPSPLQEELARMGIDFTVAQDGDFYYGKEAINEENVFCDETLKGKTLIDAIGGNEERSVELTYKQSYTTSMFLRPLYEVECEDAREVYCRGVVKFEDLRVKGEELGYRPTEKTAIENARNAVEWTNHFEHAKDFEFEATVIMNPITEEGEEFDGAGTVYLTRYVYGIKTTDACEVKFNCDGIPYEYQAYCDNFFGYSASYIDEDDLLAKLKLIDDIFGEEYEIGEKTLVKKVVNDQSFRHITAQITKTDSNGNKESMRIYVGVKGND